CREEGDSAVGVDYHVCPESSNHRRLRRRPQWPERPSLVGKDSDRVSRAGHVTTVAFARYEEQAIRTRKAGGLVTLILWLLGSGCESFNPRPLAEVGFERRAQTKTEGGVEVSVVALTATEARAALGVDLARAGIQPVWVKVE